jgi:hypothetical protein
MKLGPTPGRNTAAHLCTGEVYPHDSKSIACKFPASFVSYISNFGLSSFLQEEIGPNVLMSDISNALKLCALLHGSLSFLWISSL